VDGHGDGAIAPELDAVRLDIHGEAHSHREEIDCRQDAQRPRAARMGPREAAVAHAPVPGDHRHQH
jgi:hypothetical protein